MSALFGALFPQAPAVDRQLAGRMAEALAQRPADAAGSACFGPCLLGVRARFHSRLARPRAGFDTPQAAERTPLFVGERGVVCVADARLDRRAELASQLGLSESLPDEALLVQAYLRWGITFAEQLLGDFAFALWDPHQRRLLLVRDPFGVRALYYGFAGDVLLFASQQKALFAGGLARHAAPLRVAQYLARDFGDLEHTFYEGVLRVPPGHLLRVEQGRAQLQRYFALDPQRQLPTRSSSEYSAQFRELFVDAVRERARSVHPVGCMLSGGLDSSGVLGVLRTLAPDRDVACFSARFPDYPEIDEGRWLSLLRARGGLTISELRADRIGPLDDVEQLHELLDEPFHAPNLFIYHRLSALAASQGQAVLLDGLDGDSVVDHGFLYLHELLRERRLRRFGRELWALRRRTGMGLGSLLSDWVLGPELQQATLRLARHGFGSFGYLSRAFRKQSGFDAYLRDKSERQLSAPHGFRAQHHAVLSSPMMAFYLEVHDKVAAGHGLDHRHPFFDRRLLEFCLALPPEQRLHDGWDRVIQRRALVDLVPDPIRARQDKSVWTENFQVQLFTRHGPLLRSLIDSERSPLRGLCDMPRLRRDLRRLDSQADPGAVLDLWCAVTLGLWLQQTGLQL